MRLRTTLLGLSAALCAFGQNQGGVLQQNFRAGLPNHVKLIEGFEQKNAGKAIRLDGPRKVFLRGPAQDAAPTCAHIAVFPAPESVDPSMVLRAPEDSGDKMPIYKGLPACPQAPR